MKLRDYQQAAVDAAREELGKVEKTLIVSPTASGKSVIIGAIAKAAAENGNRLLSLCHQAEILEQNESALNRLAPEISTGIYCAGAGRKDRHAQVIFASRDSLANAPDACGNFDLVVIDEAHLVNPKPGTQYQKIFEAVTPYATVGLTGSPWRLDGGNIWKGDRNPDAFFDSVAYNISLNLLVERGYLSPYRYPEDARNIIDTSGVDVTSTGDFNLKQLDEVTSPAHIVYECLCAWENLAGRNRRCSIFFCSSLAHAQEVYKQLSEAGYKAAYIDGTTKARERRQILKDAKKGRFECLVNVGVLTTGVDIPVIDTAVCLRPTKSAALWVQMIGRALRIHEGKQDCLILDFCGNVERFGENLAQPIVQEYRRHLPEGDDEEGGEAQYKECPSCKCDIGASCRTCPYCGHLFLKSMSTPYGSLYDGKWNNVKDYDFYRAKTKSGEDCVIVEYYFGRSRPLKEWLLINRDTSFGLKARKKYQDLKTKRLKAIRIKDLQKDFPRIMAYKFHEGAEPKPESENPYEGNFYSNYGGDISF